MKGYQRIICFVVFLSIFGCMDSSQNIEDLSSNKDLVSPLNDTDALDIVLGLPETQDFIKQVENYQDIKVFGRIEESLQTHNNLEYYVIVIGENHPTHIVTWQRFLVAKETGTVLIVDVPNEGEIITLEEWQKK